MWVNGRISYEAIWATNFKNFILYTVMLLNLWNDELFDCLSYRPGKSKNTTGICLKMLLCEIFPLFNITASYSFFPFCPALSILLPYAWMGAFDFVSNTAVIYEKCKSWLQWFTRNIILQQNIVIISFNLFYMYMWIFLKFTNFS